MIEKSSALVLLRDAVNDETAAFRDGQWEAIDSIANHRKRLLVVQRTGWGKSSVYFISTRILRSQGAGPTLIVSPLLALMRNQIDAAARLGIKALSINSTNREQWQTLQGAVLDDKADALLISPERLANDSFIEKVLLPSADRIGLVVVDEAHCISDWGHDFRPDYLRLISILQRIPKTIPILGTTATANDRVIADIETQFGTIEIQRGPLMRKTLALQTIRLKSQAARLAWLATHLEKFPGTGIIYTLTKRDARQVADWLTDHGLSAKAYFSGIISDGFADSNSYRQKLEDDLFNNRIKALVATSALGMGYDKPDLGFVVHYQAPSSIIAYYQQVGRAGRAIDQALGILLAGAEDDAIHDYFRRSAFPDERLVGQILRALEESDGLSMPELEAAVNLRQGKIKHALKFLSVDDPAPVLKEGKKWLRTPVPYQMDQERISRLTAQREFEWQEVQNFIDETGCLMKFLAEALDDDEPKPCGKCASCLEHPIVDPSFSRDLAIEATRFLRQADITLNCRIQVAPSAFAEYGFKGNLSKSLRAENGRILSRLGDADWGELVQEDKQRGRFRDELVLAMAEMIQDRWQPMPSPAWITSVPSKLDPNLVPDFAERLAKMLQLPFLPLVTKVKDNEPQIAQQNRFHQCRNLDGAFAIEEQVPATPLLLMDDVIDSGWTLTVVAALLRRKGSGPVFPIALTTANLDDG